MNSREILAEGTTILSQNPEMDTVTNVSYLLIAARLKWEQEEMGGLEHVQFAYRNNTPIVPLGHECHPTELVKRGFLDGFGWAKEEKDSEVKIDVFKWPDGKHWYASVNGEEVVIYGIRKWSTPKLAELAAKRFCRKHNKHK